MPTAFGGQSQQRWGDNTLNANEYLRDIFATDLSGRATGTADARRKGMVALVFFRTTDAASARTLALLQLLADGYKESGKFSVVGVSQDDEAATRAFADANGIKFPLLIDRELYHSMVYGIAGIPTVFLADGSGMILQKIVGFKLDGLNAVSEKIAKFAEVEAVSLTE
jgi:peroxiredoxin